MDKAQAYWNNIFKIIPKNLPKTDDWLEKYMTVIKKSHDYPIIDLGCGFGNDTYYLKQRGFNVLSCDYSQAALDRLSHFIKNPNVELLDMRDPLPFNDNSVMIIICDLSLHYFDRKTTLSIIREIKRVLIKDGALICRVNSVKALPTEISNATKLEDNFYFIGEKHKRFFDESDVMDFFVGFTVGKIYSYTMERYRPNKYVLDFICINDKNGC